MVDFTNQAINQAGLTNMAGQQTTLANRANQYNPYGSMTWSQDPSGQWSQYTSLNEPYNNVNATSALASENLGQRIGRGVSTDGLGDWGSTDITQGVSMMPDGGFGATQSVIDAMRGLQQPTLQRNADAERTRLAAMGITMGSDASNDSERNLGNASSDADLKAILAGTQEYGNVFNRQLAQRQQGVDENIKRSNLTTALRGSQFQERVGQNASDIAGLGAVSGMRVDPKFASYAGATPTVAPDIYGSAVQSYNAGQAASANRTAGNLGLAGAGISALGGLGGLTGLAGQAGSALSNWFGNMTGAPGSDSWYGGFMNNGDSTDYLANQGGGSDALGDFGSNLGWW